MNIDMSYGAFYGSLRVGAYNYNGLLRDIPLVKRDAVVRGYRMVSFGPYPAVYETGDPDDKIVVDVFHFRTDVDNDCDALDWVHRMELGAGYDLTEATTDTGEKVFLYKMDSIRGANYEEVYDGDWIKYKGEAA